LTNNTQHGQGFRAQNEEQEGLRAKNMGEREPHSSVPVTFLRFYITIPMFFTPPTKRGHHQIHEKHFFSSEKSIDNLFISLLLK